LKNRFKILYNKPFHPYLHNWIIRHGHDDHIPPEGTWQPNPSNEAVPNDVMVDNGSWAAKRDTWAQQMWATRGNNRI
jgi:hypothetical protein